MNKWDCRETMVYGNQRHTASDFRIRIDLQRASEHHQSSCLSGLEGRDSICTYSQNRIFKHPRVNLQLSTLRGKHFQLACQRFSKVMLKAKASHIYSINEEETNCSPPLILLFCFHVPLGRAGSRAGSMSLPEANMESDQLTPGQKC